MKYLIILFITIGCIRTDGVKSDMDEIRCELKIIKCLNELDDSSILNKCGGKCSSKTEVAKAIDELCNKKTCCKTID